MDVRLTPAGLPSAPAGVIVLNVVGPGPSGLRVLSNARKVCEDLLYEDQGITHIASDAYSPPVAEAPDLVKRGFLVIPPGRMFSTLTRVAVPPNWASSVWRSSDGEISHQMRRIR